MAPRKKAKPKAKGKAKANALSSDSRRKANGIAMPAKSEALASSSMMYGANMEDGKDGVELLNNLRSEVDGTLAVVEADGKTDGSGDKKLVAGEVNCEGVILGQQEGGVEKITKKKIIGSRKRIRTSTIMAKSALKGQDEPTCSYKKKLNRVNEELKEHKIGDDDVPNIDDDKNNVAYGNIGKVKVGVDVGDSVGDKVKVNTKKEVGENSNKKRKRLNLKSRKSALVEGSLVKVATESEGKSGLANEKNGLLEAETKGMIFMCSTKTKPDCYRYMVLGSPAKKRVIVEKICKGMILFLYDIDKKLLYGIYKAAAHGGYDIEPEAFKSRYPAQVSFEILEDCLPLDETMFGKVIRDNYYTPTKFHCPLNSRQVENLRKLFRFERRRSRRVDRVFRDVREQKREKEKAKVKAAQARFVGERHRARLPPARKGRHHRDRPLVHNDVDSLSRWPVRLPLVTDSSYAYERNLDREVYMGEPFVGHHEIYRRQRLLEPRDTYRRDVLLEHHDTYSLDPYSEHGSSYRQERLLVPEDLYRVEQPPLQSRDSYRQYPALERRNYDLETLAGRRNYDLESLGERRHSYRRWGSLLDHQDFYRKDPILERQDHHQLILESRHSNRREREEILLSRQDHSAYSGGVYSTARPLRAPESRSVRTVYPYAAEPEPVYYSHRSVYRL